MQSFFLGDPRSPYGYIEITIHPWLGYRCETEPVQRNATVPTEGGFLGTRESSSRHTPLTPCDYSGTSDGCPRSARRARVRGRSPPPCYSPSAEENDATPEDDQWTTHLPYSRLMDGPGRVRTRGFPEFTGPIPGPSWFRPRGFSIEVSHSNILRRARMANREQPLSPAINPQPLCDEKEPSFSPVISDKESDQRE